MSVTASEPASSRLTDSRNANRADYERKAREATAELIQRAEAYDRGEIDWLGRMFGRPKIRTITPEDLAGRDAKETAEVCPNCFAPLDDGVWFYSRRGGCREVPTCRECFETNQRDQCEFWADHYERMGWGRSHWFITSLGQRQSARCAGCGRTMTFGASHMVVRACSTACDRVTDNERRRTHRADIRNGATCEQCGSTFDPPRTGARYCKPACRQKAYRARKATP
jgi:hypothetical protein